MSYCDILRCNVSSYVELLHVESYYDVICIKSRKQHSHKTRDPATTQLREHDGAVLCELMVLAPAWGKLCQQGPFENVSTHTHVHKLRQPRPSSASPPPPPSPSALRVRAQGRNRNSFCELQHVESCTLRRLRWPESTARESMDSQLRGDEQSIKSQLRDDKESTEVR